VLIQDVTRELAESFGMSKPQGALIAKVLSDSPAEGAGFEVGDVVLAFNEQPVNRSSDLPPIVGRTRVGTKVPVSILRNGEAKTLYVITAELPEENKLASAEPVAPGSAEDNELGLAVTDLTAEQREQFDVPEHGVIVSEVGSGPARRAGIRKGDIVLMLNNVKVESSAAFKDLASELPAGKAVSILVQRQGNPIFLALKTDD
jgi:serine protease Do